MARSRSGLPHHTDPATNDLHAASLKQPSMQQQPEVVEQSGRRRIVRAAKIFSYTQSTAEESLSFFVFRLALQHQCKHVQRVHILHRVGPRGCLRKARSRVGKLEQRPGSCSPLDERRRASTTLPRGTGLCWQLPQVAGSRRLFFVGSERYAGRFPRTRLDQLAGLLNVASFPQLHRSYYSVIGEV